jgi:Undecaprenyl-phosphate galactose phosphotransferase WbaP
VNQVTADLVTPSMRIRTRDLVGVDEPSPSAPELPRARGMFAEVEGVPVVGGFALAPVLAKRLGISYAILALPNQSGEQLLEITERIGGAFSHLLVIPDLAGFASLGVPARDVGGVLGIEVRQQLMLPWPRFAKRVMDVSLTLVGGLFILPFLVLLCLAIKVDSRGPVFYFQERIGRDGKRFRAAKFRSMHGDGEARLKAVLDADPKLKAEYEEFHKLTNDPRVTRVGRIVRKYSLDELPQLWNVLRGDMSLIGPRPYLDREVPEMQGKEGIILRAMPGMTGLWQVSDRNATGFSARLKMDVHYVRNWSPWLDVYILARTVGVVIRGTGV